MAFPLRSGKRGQDTGSYDLARRMSMCLPKASRKAARKAGWRWTMRKRLLWPVGMSGLRSRGSRRSMATSVTAPPVSETRMPGPKGEDTGRTFMASPSLRPAKYWRQMAKAMSGALRKAVWIRKRAAFPGRSRKGRGAFPASGTVKAGRRAMVLLPYRSRASAVSKRSSSRRAISSGWSLLTWRRKPATARTVRSMVPEETPFPSSVPLAFASKQSSSSSFVRERMWARPGSGLGHLRSRARFRIPVMSRSLVPPEAEGSFDVRGEARRS